jgi:uncharacterized protein with PIN domain
MSTVFIRFYEELNDFLPSHKRKVLYPVGFSGNPGVKQIIEAEGVPHAEIDLVLVNGKSVSLDHKITDNDTVSVYPVFESFDISSIQVVHLKPLREPRFVLDVHLGKLTRYLRMLGLDSIYENWFSDNDIIGISIKEQRTILTRDKRLLMRKEIDRGYWMRNQMILDQVNEVLKRFDLKHSITFFSRCTLCNGENCKISEDMAMLEFPGYRFYPGTAFYQCTACHHIYWHGSHCDRFEKVIAQILH